MTSTMRDYARQALATVLAFKDHQVPLDRIATDADPVRDRDGPNWLVKWLNRDQLPLAEGRFYPEGEAGGVLWLYRLTPAGESPVSAPDERHYFSGVNALGWPCYIGPEALVRYIQAAVRIILERHEIIIPDQAVSVLPQMTDQDGKQYHPAGYEGKTDGIVAEAKYWGDTQCGRLIVHRIDHPRWPKSGQTFAIVDHFAGYDHVRQPNWLPRLETPRSPATAQAA